MFVTFDGAAATNIVLTGTNTIQNSQCLINAAGSTVVKNGNQLTLNLNITFKPIVWQRVVRGIRSAGAAYGRTDLGHGERVNVEYVSANPTGPMHVGHCRGAVFGDALASLLQFPATT